MRFDTLRSSRTAAPSFAARRARLSLILFAAAEVLMLCLMAVLYLKLKALIDPALLLSGLIVLVGLVSLGVIRSLVVAQSVLFLCVLALEFALYTDLPTFSWNLYGLSIATADWQPVVLVGLDLLLLAWILTKGLALSADESMDIHAPASNDSSLNDPSFSERTQR